MRLQDEYIKRHKLNIKPIYHTYQTNIILKDNRPRMIVIIKWEDNTRSPGHYVIRFLNPNHNGYLDGKYFNEGVADLYYQYNEYLEFIAKWVQHLDLQAVQSNQIKLAIWEIFLYCFDGWIAEHNLEEMSFVAANVNLSEHERINAINSFLQHLEKHDYLIFQIYNSEFKKYEDNYADWLVELIGDKKNAGT